MGGLIKKMPRTAFLFLLAALAYADSLPLTASFPNFSFIRDCMEPWATPQISAVVMNPCHRGLALIGGLALLVSPKAFGHHFPGN